MKCTYCGKTGRMRVGHTYSAGELKVREQTCSQCRRTRAYVIMPVLNAESAFRLAAKMRRAIEEESDAASR